MNKTIDRAERKEAAAIVDRAIRMLLVGRRMTMPEVAKRADIPLPTLYGKLRGNGPLELREVQRIASAFELTEIELLQLGEQPNEGGRFTTWMMASEPPVASIVAA